ncbi:plasma membrane calcium [Pseudocyphellaria aurata]|nr:plasma membrane calcium [Pseudocyphellaria aurata]
MSNKLLAPPISISISPYHQNSSPEADANSSTSNASDHPIFSLQVPASPTATSLGGDTLRSRANSFNSIAETARSRANSDVKTVKSTYEGSDMTDEDALRPENRNRNDFEVIDNPFAFSPGQLGKTINPKSLAAFRALGGIKGLEKGLKTDIVAGLSVDETLISEKISFEEATRPEKSKETLGPTISPEESILPKDQVAGQFHDRKRVFKDNRLPTSKPLSIWRLFWNAFNDRVLLILTAAAVVSLALGVYEAVGQDKSDSEPQSLDWVEGLAIAIAVAIVVLVTGLNDYRREKQFVALNAKKDDRQVKAIRSGKSVLISVYDVMVGDVLHLESGDSVPADGILIDGHGIRCDESSATGESDAMKKTSGSEVWNRIMNETATSKLDPFLISGSKVLEGVGTYLVTAVGVNSSFGQVMVSLQTENEGTPLQIKLARMANWIGYLGTGAAGLLFFILLVRFLAGLSSNNETSAKKGSAFLDILIVAVTIIVVAVPEGLPVAVTLALSFATKKMLKENNLVRHLRACETMGNATTICSDKTGTLTQNKMTVVEGVLGSNLHFARDPASTTEDDILTFPAAFERTSESVKKLMVQSSAINSTAFEGEEDGKITFIGSKTETAILTLAKEQLGMGPVAEERAGVDVVQLIPFDSDRKCMGVVIRLKSGGYRLLVKGAAELLLAMATSELGDVSDESLQKRDLSDSSRRQLSSDINHFASNSLRTIAMLYKDFPQWPPAGAETLEGDPSMAVFEDVCQKMTFLCLVGIQDPLREGVAQAVQKCQDAGVVVRMVTGDNVATASAIATQCGIKTPDGLVMEGPKFRELSDEKMDELLPRLQVLARSSPDDKRILVSRLKHLGETVAVTGDGTNDGPALKIADVGFSMGIAGTEVAKEASAIILLDDNFSSIVSAIMWGRSVNDAVAKFLQFQITVNITAVILAFVSAVSSSDSQSVLSAVQLLWVNLIMDTFAALALATDAPTEKILDRKPTPKRAALITTNMWKMILGQAVYQLVVTFTLYFAGFSILGYSTRVKNTVGTQAQTDLSDVLHTELNTIVFNTFVWMQIFNEFNNRRLDNKLNIFEGVHRNYFFLVINAIMIGGQVLIIFVGGLAFQIKRIDGTQWAVCIGCAVPCLLWAIILRSIPDKYAAKLFAFAGKIWLAIARPVLRVLALIFTPVAQGWRVLSSAVFQPAHRFCKRTIGMIFRRKAAPNKASSTDEEGGNMKLKSRNVPQMSHELPRQPPPITLTTAS